MRYCKSTIFQANHNKKPPSQRSPLVVCDTAKVRFFKQITTVMRCFSRLERCLRYCKSTIFQANHNFTRSANSLFWLFAILQKYDFSSKSQRDGCFGFGVNSCLRYCKSTIFQANHNMSLRGVYEFLLFAILQKYDFSSKSQQVFYD